MKKRLICMALVFCVLLSLSPSALAGATLDNHATGSFSENFAVYTGPGEYYYRANNGKASYGGGTARIYGTDGDWLLIGYMLKDGAYRIGYIPKRALSTAGKITGKINYNLAFDYTVAYADDYCRVTDDPIMNQKMFYTIPENTPVTVLATLGNPWTYIEVDSPNGPIRGFVWSIHLRALPSGTAASAAAAAVSSGTAAPSGNAAAALTDIAWVNPNPTAAPTAAPVGSLSLYHDKTKGDWLPKYIDSEISGSWEVYSGPGEYYYRANNSKATMGGGNCRIYGVENGWVMIGYGLSNGNYRIGYIKQDAIARRNLTVPYLDLKYTTRQLKSEAKLTDDIARKRTTLVTLKEGAYVLFLGYVSEANITWAYVEVMANNSIMRGFIHASALQ